MTVMNDRKKIKTNYFLIFNYFTLAKGTIINLKEEKSLVLIR